MKVSDEACAIFKEMSSFYEAEIFPEDDQLLTWINRIEVLVDRVYDLEEDAARLDWMDSNAFSAYRSTDPMYALSKHCVVVSESRIPRVGNVGDTIRQAIDKALGGQP
jgi:hypothetical protein